MKTPKTIFCVALLAGTGLVHAATSYTPVNYGAPSAAEQDALDRINAFRADPQNELYDMFVEQGYGGSKATFDALLNGKTSYSQYEGWWINNFGGNVATYSMEFFATVPSVLNAQFAALPSSVSSVSWNDNLGWSAYRYAVFVEQDAGANNPHAIPGPLSTLSTRLTSAGVNWLGAAENIAPDWENDTALMHMGFAIDWGPGPNGIQSPAGHRANMLNSTIDSVAIGIVDAGAAWAPNYYPNYVTQVQHLVDINNTNPDDPIFYGYVTDADTAARLVGVNVELFNASNVSLGTATTDATGGYTIQYTNNGTPTYAKYIYNGTTYNTTGTSLGNSGDNYFMDAALSAVPEPSSALLVALGTGACLMRRREGRA